jgi:hypothetical protein
MTARAKGADKKGIGFPPFVHFAPIESDLVAKVGIREPEHWFGCVGSATIAPKRYHESDLPGAPAGFEPAGSRSADPSLSQ